MSGGSIWVGKDDVKHVVENGEVLIASDESTTELPLEMQTAIEGLLSWSWRPGRGDDVLGLALRQSPEYRIEPYSDFSKPRRIAAQDARNLINRGKPVATFQRNNDPTSLILVQGFEPDFAAGIIERSFSQSRLFGGRLRRLRILSVNRKIQFFFLAGPRHVWLFPPQAMTTELSNYGVRTISVNADENLFLPGYEYHHYEETG